MVALEEKEMKNFLPFLAKMTGLAIRDDRLPFLQKKIVERMSACSIDAQEKYIRLVTSPDEGEEELLNLVDLLTIGETYFFRNESHFKALTDNVLPELIADKIKVASVDGSSRPSIRIWCAGCSTGEEPYSLAILLREMLPRFSEWNISILATDINREVLERAKLGRYSARSVSHLPKKYLEKYFTVFGEKYSLDESIKGMVRLMRHNLVGDSYEYESMSDLDIIFCRNVTIYFDFDTTKTVMSRFAEHLLPSGCIFIGHAETLWNVSGEFRPVELSGTFIYQKDGNEKRAAKSEMPVPNLPIPSYGVESISEHIDRKNPEQRANQKIVDELMVKCTALADKGELEEALLCTRKLVEVDNLYLPAYYLAGVLLEKMEKFEEAMDEFRRVLYIDPDLAICYFNLGSILRFLKRSDDAKREYENCLKFLDARDENEEVFLTEGLTVGVLSQAVYRVLESL